MWSIMEDSVFWYLSYSLLLKTLLKGKRHLGFSFICRGFAVLLIKMSSWPTLMNSECRNIALSNGASSSVLFSYELQRAGTYSLWLGFRQVAGSPSY